MRKKKRMKMLLVWCLILTVLAAVLFFVRKKTSVWEKESSAPDLLNDLTVTDIESFEIVKSEGDTLSFSLDDGKWQLDASDGEHLSSDQIDQTKAGAAAASLTGVRLVQTLEHPGELSEYGLEEPSYTVTVRKKSGESIRMAVGNTNDMTGDVYLYLDDDPSRIYAVSSSVLASLQYGKTDYAAPEGSGTGGA